MSTLLKLYSQSGFSFDLTNLRQQKRVPLNPNFAGIYFVINFEIDDFVLSVAA